MLLGVPMDGVVGRPRVVIHPDDVPPPPREMPTFALDRREWDVLDDFTVIHRGLTPRRKV